jgi:hypothetical protein
MGFTVERNNFSKMVSSGATLDPKAIASNIFKDFQDHGWELIYKAKPGSSDPTAVSLNEATTVIFQSSNTVDPLSPLNTTHAANPVEDKKKYRVGFIVDGYQNNQLIMYLGTVETMNEAEGINTTYSHRCVLIQGGESITSTRMSESYQYSYRYTQTSRGFALIVWDQLRIEDMRYMGLVCCQRPVKCDGTTFITGTQPVFAIHNTVPRVGASELSDKWYYTVVREKDTDVPTTGSEMAAAGTRATAYVEFKAPAGVASIDAGNLTINGAKFVINPTSGLLAGEHKLTTGTPVALAKNLVDAINADTWDNRINGRVIASVTTDNLSRVFMYSAKPGRVADLGLSMSSSNAATIMVTPWAGGVDSAVAATGTVTFKGVPAYSTTSDPSALSDSIVLNNVTYTFTDGNPGDRQIKVVPGNVEQTLNNVVNVLRASSLGAIKVASYNGNYDPTSGNGYLTITYNSKGVDGNRYSISVTSPTDKITAPPTLSGGTGYDPNVTGVVYSNELSNQSGNLGNSIHHFPNAWRSPVTTDDGEYVLVFPFGLTTTRMAYTEEMDLIAISKGPAYQGGQAVNINVYGEAREYTAYSSNYGTRPDEFIRVFVLTSGGGSN